MIILQLDKLTSEELEQLSVAIHAERRRRFVPYPLTLSEKTCAEVSEIETIKLLRNRTHCSLTEAKWSVDAYRHAH